MIFSQESSVNFYLMCAPRMTWLIISFPEFQVFPAQTSDKSILTKSVGTDVHTLTLVMGNEMDPRVWESQRVLTEFSNWVLHK